MTRTQFLAVLDRVRDLVASNAEPIDSFSIIYGRFTPTERHYPGIVLEADFGDEDEFEYRMPVPEEPKPSPKPKAKK